MNRCEDYPCCGHTDGLPCDWTYTPEAQAFDMEHAMCDHESGFCDVEPDEDDCEDCGNEIDFCTCEDDDWPMEDQWLDGSYEE